jgi:hypothetical protein
MYGRGRTGECRYFLQFLYMYCTGTGTGTVRLGTVPVRRGTGAVYNLKGACVIQFGTVR